jgi:hypothetical protein
VQPPSITNTVDADVTTAKPVNGLDVISTPVTPYIHVSPVRREMSTEEDDIGVDWMKKLLGKASRNDEASKHKMQVEDEAYLRKVLARTVNTPSGVNQLENLLIVFPHRQETIINIWNSMSRIPFSAVLNQSVIFQEAQGDRMMKLLAEDLELGDGNEPNASIKEKQAFYKELMAETANEECGVGILTNLLYNFPH